MPETIGYVACCYDRHIDPEVAIFMDFDSAIVWTADWMEQHVEHPELLKEEEVEGFHYWLSYGEEQDHAFVKEAQIHEAT
jgi:hypothetical protein